MSKLRTLRESRGWSRFVLGVKSGMNPASIYLIETGKRKPNLETAYKLANAFCLPVEEVFPNE